MGLKNQYLLLLFVFGVVARGLVKTAFGANVSLSFLLALAVYYWYSKRQERSVYDDIARLQAQSAAKLDALHGRGDGRVTEMSMASRQTQFVLRPEEASIVTDRMRQYSKKFGGSLQDRRKFLKRNAKPRQTADGEEVDINDPAQVARLVETSHSAAGGDKKAKKAGKGRKKDPAVEKIVEEAVDATL